MSGQERQALVTRWLHLTREALPAIAGAHRWPVRLDHCFMRICLDKAAGRPWHEVIARPAVRHATLDQLRRAVEVAEAALADPSILPELNRESLAGRRRRMPGSAP